MAEPAPYLQDLAEAPAGGAAFWFRAGDGVRLRAAVWPVAGARATVIILPGRTEHAEKYGPLATRLAARGYASAAVDWRGQGLADRLLPDRRKGHVRRFADYGRDLAALLALPEVAALPGRRMLVAHSMGGAIGLGALMRGLPFAAAAFSAPMWGIRVPGGREGPVRLALQALSAAGFGNRYAPTSTGPVCYAETAPFEDNVLTTDRERWDWLRRHFAAWPDLALGGPTVRWVAESLAHCATMARLPSPAVPCVTAIGDNERVIDIPAVEARMARWQSGRLLRLAGAEHELPIEAPRFRDAFSDAAADLFDAA
jgi:lysophospholipase